MFIFIVAVVHFFSFYKVCIPASWEAAKLCQLFSEKGYQRLLLLPVSLLPERYSPTQLTLHSICFITSPLMIITATGLYRDLASSTQQLSLSLSYVVDITQLLCLTNTYYPNTHINSLDGPHLPDQPVITATRWLIYTHHRTPPLAMSSTHRRLNVHSFTPTRSLQSGSLPRTTTTNINTNIDDNNNNRKNNQKRGSKQWSPCALVGSLRSSEVSSQWSEASAAWSFLGQCNESTEATESSIDLIDVSIFLLLFLYLGLFGHSLTQQLLPLSAFRHFFISSTIFFPMQAAIKIATMKKWLLIGLNVSVDTFLSFLIFSA